MKCKLPAPKWNIAVVGGAALECVSEAEQLAGALETGHTSEGMSSVGRWGYGVACLWLGQLLPMDQVYETLRAYTELNEQGWFAQLTCLSVET